MNIGYLFASCDQGFQFTSCPAVATRYKRTLEKAGRFQVLHEIESCSFLSRDEFWCREMDLDQPGNYRVFDAIAINYGIKSI